MKQNQINRDAAVEQLICAFKRLRRSEMSRSFPEMEWKKSEAKALMFLNETTGREGKKVSEISHFLNVTSPFVTQLLNRLEQKGLIFRRMDQADRRIVRIFLTEVGRSAADEVHKKLNQWFGQLVSYLGETESRQFADLIHKMSDFIECKKTEKKVET
ncbi:MULTISPECIES: MarR family winged helix-turn-helix transcriptional regulator [Bacillus]|uniref:MarR family transcriptional regulator n=1 Tax=Bacillus glycinifermentans TaxID=1664069 RepID=A0AAJ4D2J1_9BACI|nr:MULTISPECIES: MarR family transcriptional regulator [Bacillus]KKB73652.1 MarR family transcriptional regulator [Bacillus sp. TH008]MBU8785082.1 MarR family transcriptional regulator [Bacillus glycinifermentans]MDU0073738.1 MarR family transcriptional regulator [Bacillus sp. IG6]MED8021618.1 MarR family transcriptional regulator [Bacillus glycinifermentans]NUJ15254.1 MarR family transcriptional regulator [Bacillus glycinifermentans]